MPKQTTNGSNIHLWCALKSCKIMIICHHTKITDGQTVICLIYKILVSGMP